jgi:hypothetical protein
MDRDGEYGMKYIIINVIILFSFPSCGLIVNGEISSVYNRSRNTIDAVIQELSGKKLIFISETHTGLNEELFLANNIISLYDSGVRYIFLEGGLSLNKDNDEYTQFPIFYPWREAGWRYENQRLFDTISNFNTGLSDENKIKIVYPESTIKSYAITNDNSYLNYRDLIAAENIINIMDGEEDHIKAIICYGEAHGSINLKKDKITDRVPLGYLLKIRYGEYFGSYVLISGTDYIRKKVTKWDNIVLDSRFISSNDINKNLIAYITGTSSIFDGYIFEKTMLYGNFYQYRPNILVVKYLYNLVNGYLIGVPDNDIVDFLNYQSRFLNYETQFIKALYYLKLYFGDMFEYEYWSSQHNTNLKTALDKLQTYIYDEALNTNIEFDYDRASEFSQYMAESNLEYNIKNNNFELAIYYLSKAYDVFPDDIWSLYWLAYSEAELKHYSQALFYFQLLFKSDLSSFIETLPIVYKKAAYCANKINNRRLADEYLNISKILYNEFEIEQTNYDMNYILEK